MAWTDKLIRFPQERRTAAVDDYRAEPAVILYIPTLPARVRRAGLASLPQYDPGPCGLTFEDVVQPLLLDPGPRQRCVEAFDALNEAIRDEYLPPCTPGFYWVW